MAIHDLRKTPFPWFGGKSDAAPHVWAALGDVDHYVEPFAGSLAVLMRRPHTANRTYYSETVNDVDGLLINAWRSIQHSPDATAEAASWPVTEADIMSRHLALLRWRSERNLELLMADPEWHDPKMGGWWMYGQSGWIGSGWCSGDGAWVVGDDGRIVKRAKAGRGEGVRRKVPFLTANGRGVTRPQLREEGVGRQLPFVGNNGQGVAHGNLREEGVGRQLPFLSVNGQGVNNPGTHEEGVAIEHEFHPMTMPELRRWFGYLSARLRHVRVLNGDWSRVCTDGALKSLPVRQGGVCGVFVDPPYADTAGRADVYSHEDQQVAHRVREWALGHTDSKWLRVVMAGFEGEHDGAFESAGWRAVEWYRAGHLKGGMGNVGANGTQMHRDRLWLSPSCLAPVDERQTSLWGAP
jgi:site-specific DNA-adenine methylase